MSSLSFFLQVLFGRWLKHLDRWWLSCHGRWLRHSFLLWHGLRRNQGDEILTETSVPSVPQILVDSGRFWRILVLARVPMGWNESKCEIGHCGCETLNPSSQRHSSTATYGAKPTRFGDVILTRLSLSRCLVFSCFLVVSLPRCFAMHPAGGAWSLDASRLWSSGTSATVWHGTSMY